MSATSRDRTFPGSVRRALLFLVLVVLVPVTLLQAGIYIAWYRSQKDEQLDANLEVARAVGVAFEGYVRDIQRQELAIGLAIAGPRSHSPAEMQSLLASIAREYPVVDSWHWADRQGTIRASTRAEAIGTGLADREYWKEIEAARPWVLSDRMTDKATGKPLFAVARRIEDGGGLKGVMVAEVNPAELGVLAFDPERVEDGAFSVFDRQGALVYRVPQIENAEQDWRRADPLLDATLRNREEAVGTFVLPADGRPRFAARVPLKSGWVVGASRATSVAMAEVHAALWVVLGLNLLVVAVSVGLAAGAGRRILRWAHEAQDQATALLERRVEERTAELSAAVRKLETEIHERRRAEQALREQSGTLEAFFEHSMTCLVFLDPQFNFLRVNEAYARACGRAVSDFPGRNHFELYPDEENETIFADVVRTKRPYRAAAKPFVFPDHPEWGTTWWDWTLTPILDEAGEVRFLVFSLDDVTPREQAKRRDNFTRDLLGLFAGKSSRKEYLDAAVEMLRDWTGCRCVGIRLRDDQDRVPYESQVGFSAEFLASENALCLAGDTCACLRVFQAAPDPQDVPALTLDGSFRCENMPQFIDGLGEPARYHGNCVRAGYASLVTIPIRYRGQTLGLIHLADQRRGMVSASGAEFLEVLAPLIGEAIRRFEVEEELRAASLYARSLIEASLDPLVTISAEGKITDVNRATEEATGAPRDRLIGSDFSDYFTAPEQARAGYRRVLAEGFVRDYPLTVRHLSGRTIDVLYNATVYRDEAGQVQGVFAAARDVTERKRMEEELRAASLYARSLIEASLDPLVTISAEGKITDVNRATEEATGAPRDRLIGSDFSDYFTAPEQARAGYRRVLAEGFVRDYPLTVRHLSGRRIDVLYNATVYRDEAGQVQGVFAAARDVTERKRAERALWESEERYRSLVVAASQIVWTTDAGGLVESDMPSWRGFTGQSEEEIRGDGWSRALHPDDRAATLAVWSRAVTTRSLYDTQYRLRRRDGHYRHMAVRGVPVLEPDGTIREWVGTCTDITERREAEEELDRYRQHLEKLVAERTEELARSNRELEQFAYVASHDLQEPLRVITGYLQLIARRYRGQIDADADQFIHYTVDGAKRMQQLINDLLEYSRVGTRGKPLEATEAEAALQRALAALQTTIEEAGAVVTYNPLPAVLADELQLGQVFQNLIGNAIKFRGPCPPAVHVSARRDGDAWVFAVRDNGIGIEPQYWEQIFTIFQRLHTRDEYSGTGIGLAICKRIVERHGGRIWVESQPGQGCTFCFTLGGIDREQGIVNDEELTPDDEDRPRWKSRV